MKIKGFTLIEIMVALMIFAVLSLIVTQSLSTAIKTKDRFTQHDPDAEALPLALMIVSRDLQQIINRPIVDSAGRNEAALFHDISTSRLYFTRIGVKQANDPSAVARIGFELQKRTLMRLHWPYLDRKLETVVKTPLLDNVSGLSWEFVGKDGKTYSHWPPIQQWVNELPIAVQLKLTLENGVVSIWILTTGQIYAG